MLRTAATLLLGIVLGLASVFGYAQLRGEQCYLVSLTEAIDDVNGGDYQLRMLYTQPNGSSVAHVCRSRLTFLR